MTGNPTHSTLDFVTSPDAGTSTPLKRKENTTRAARYIRFSPEEYEKLLDDEKKTRLGAQDLLKRAYFGGGGIALLMTDEDRDRLMTELSRIGANVNQIAKKVNSGFREGFNQEIVEVRTHLTMILTWLTAKYSHYRT